MNITASPVPQVIQAAANIVTETDSDILFLLPFPPLTAFQYLVIPSHPQAVTFLLYPLSSQCQNLCTLHSRAPQTTAKAMCLCIGILLDARGPDRL